MRRGGRLRAVWRKVRGSPKAAARAARGKKYVETGALGDGMGKNSEVHKAAIVGDTLWRVLLLVGILHSVEIQTGA